MVRQANSGLIVGCFGKARAVEGVGTNRAGIASIRLAELPGHEAHRVFGIAESRNQCTGHRKPEYWRDMPSRLQTSTITKRLAFAVQGDQGEGFCENLH